MVVDESENFLEHANTVLHSVCVALVEEAKTTNDLADLLSVLFSMTVQHAFIMSGEDRTCTEKVVREAIEFYLCHVMEANEGL